MGENMIVAEVSKHCSETIWVDYRLAIKHGIKSPIRMTEHFPMGEGDVHYVYVEFDDGTAEKVCRPDFIGYK